jgi:hypothetical protein
MSLENNIILGAVGLLLYFSFKNNKNLVENFVNVPITHTVQRVVQQDHKPSFMIPPAYAKSERDQMFMVPANLQATLPPRQGGMYDIGPNIRYDLPDKSKRADTMGSLAMYSGGNGETTRVIEGYKPASAAKLSELDNTMIDTRKENETNFNTDELGKIEPQETIMNRLIYAPLKSFKTQGADFIRGDLPITPDQGCWFRPSANPSTDLRGGALAAIGGMNNETTKELLALKSAAMGQMSNVGSGVKYTVEKSAYLSSGGGDVNIKTTSFY